MRILAINGSHRGKKGYTHSLINKLFEGATAAGAECEVVSLAEMTVHRCLSCGRCHLAQYRRQCVFDDKDDVRSVFQKMTDADLIVYATPVYVFAMSGLLKTFLDRMYVAGDVLDLKLSASGLMFHQVDKAICSKPFVTLVSCDNVEAEAPKNVLSYFRTFSRFMDAPQVGSLVRNAARLAGHGQDPEREKKLPKLRKVYKAYEQAGRELATEGRIRRATQRRANRQIVPGPVFALARRVPSRLLKRWFLARARKWQERNG